MEHTIVTIQKQLDALDIDALLITHLDHLRYVAHFTGTAGAILLTRSAQYFITDARYTEQAKQQAVAFEVVEHTGPIAEEVNRLAVKHQVRTLGFESAYVTYQTVKQWETVFTATLVPITHVIEPLREIKNDAEIAKIKRACAIADEAFQHIITKIKPGISELAIATELDFYMRSLGASGVSFDTIVASGHRSAMPHGVASHKIIEKGDFVTLDYGCFYEGYVSDITRTVSVGEPKHPELKNVYDSVLQAQLAVSKAVKPGITAASLDRIARQAITDSGYGQYFVHSTGHGIGLEVHESPGISSRNENPLKPGMVITNEPGIYIAGIGGVRIEDDILVTTDSSELLSHSERTLLIL